MGTQDIKITPRTGSTTGLPEIFFQGSGTTASGITMSVHGSGDIVYSGYQGELFRLTNNLQTGTIFSVKDISGLDQIALDASGDLNLNTYYGSTSLGGNVSYKPFTISTGVGQGDTDWTTLGSNTYAITGSDAFYYLVAAGTGNRTIDLPAPTSGIPGRTYTVKKVDSVSGVVEIQSGVAGSHSGLFCENDTISLTCAEGATIGQYEWHNVNETLAAHVGVLEQQTIDADDYGQVITYDTWVQVNLDTSVVARPTGLAQPGPPMTDFWTGTPEGKFVIKRRGVYLVTACVWYDNAIDASERADISISINGSRIRSVRGYQAYSNNQYVTTQISTIQELEVGDYLELWTYQTHNTALRLHLGSKARPLFEITEIL